MATDNNLGFTFDAEHELKDAGLVAASAAATVDGAAKIVDVGASVFMGTAVFDVSAIEIASNDEIYTLCIQGSSSATFASSVENLATLDLGATEVRKGGAIDSTAGRYLLPFVNVQDGVTYRYIRHYIHIAGAIATGINHTAWIGKKL